MNNELTPFPNASWIDIWSNETNRDFATLTGLEYLEIDGQPSKRTRKGYPATLGRMGEKDLDAFKPHPDKTYAANIVTDARPR